MRTNDVSSCGLDISGGPAFAWLTLALRANLFVGPGVLSLSLSALYLPGVENFKGWAEEVIFVSVLDAL